MPEGAATATSTLRNVVAHNAVFFFGWATYCNLQRPIIKVLNYISGALSCTTISLHSKQASESSFSSSLSHSRKRSGRWNSAEPGRARLSKRRSAARLHERVSSSHRESHARTRCQAKDKTKLPGGKHVRSAAGLQPQRARLSAALHVRPTDHRHARECENVTVLFLCSGIWGGAGPKVSLERKKEKKKEGMAPTSAPHRGAVHMRAFSLCLLFASGCLPCRCSSPIGKRPRPPHPSSSLTLQAKDGLQRAMSHDETRRGWPGPSVHPRWGEGACVLG